MASQFRRIALGLQQSIEGSHMGHADFRLRGGKIFATLNADETCGMVALTPEQQKHFLARYPAMFTPASGAWGVSGSTMVELSAADAEVVGEALTCAWQRAQDAATAKTRRAPSTARRRAKRR
jgi:hypothetical protein